MAVPFSDHDAQAPGNQADACLDLRGTPCPLNFVRAKLSLEKLGPGQVLQVLLDRGEPAEQVPAGLAESGHLLERLETQDDFFVLWVRCATHGVP